MWLLLVMAVIGAVLLWHAADYLTLKGAKNVNSKLLPTLKAKRWDVWRGILAQWEGLAGIGLIAISAILLFPH